MKMKWLLGVSAALLVVVLIGVGLSGCSAGGTITGEWPTTLRVSLDNQQGIWVSGEGKVTVTPDIATISLGIAAQSKTVAEAQSQAAAAMAQVMKALTDNGIAEKDIQTQYFSITQVTRWDENKQEEVVIGYQVNNTVSAKIRDIDTDPEKAGSIIDAVAAAGGDLTRISGINFSVDDPTLYYEEARGKAIADARDKAEQIAKLAGVSLGNPTYISEYVSMPTIYRDVVYKSEGMSPSPLTPISAGETEIILTVQITFAIQQ